MVVLCGATGVINIPPSVLLFLVLGIGCGLFKFWLILSWTQRLHNKHGGRYQYSTIFATMFGRQPNNNMDADLWQDFEPIQRWNVVSNILIALVGAIYVILLGLGKRLGWY